MTTKVLLDTDIGSDIDDAVCLAYLLAHPACDLLGITTVSGEGEQRARMASALCRLAGKEVPIYVGTESPLLVPGRQPQAPQAAALTRWDHQQRFPIGQAIEFLSHTIRAHPGEVTLLSIGPLTNVALLFASDPEAARLLRGLVMMCGVFTTSSGATTSTTGSPETAPLLSERKPLPGREWNALLDPHATAMVYRTPVAVHRSIGLDVTTQVVMNAAQVRDAFRGPLLSAVLDFAEIWFKQRGQLTFHDPLAAVTVLNDQICRFERGQVDAVWDGGDEAGTTRWTPAADGAHEVACGVDPQAFFTEYFSVFK